MKETMMYQEKAMYAAKQSKAVQDSIQNVGAIRGGTDGDCIKISEIPERVSGLFHQIEMLTEAADRLVSRISPVLRPAPPQGTESPCTSPDNTAIGSQLSEARSRLQYAHGILLSALDRLEL